MRVTFQIEGAAEFDRQLATLPLRVQRKVIRQAARAAQRIMLNAERASARAMVGGEMGQRIAQALQIRAARKQVAGSYALNVQLRRGVEEFFGPGKRSGRRTFIPAAIEYGHLAGNTFVPPIPFARSAAEAAQRAAMQRFTDQLRQGLLREAIVGRYR